MSRRGGTAEVAGTSARRWLSYLGNVLHVEPLQWRLFLIVFVGLLPLVLLTSALLIHNARLQREQLLDATEDTMRAVITAVDYESHESLAALSVLAASPALAAGDLAAFRWHARELMAQRPGWANVVLSDPDGRQLLNAMGDVAPQSLEPGTLEAAIASNAPVVGDMLYSPLLDMYGFGLRVPVLDDQRQQYVLTAAIRPHSVQELLMSQAIPAGGVVAIFDRNYRIVARSRDFEERLSQPASPGMRALMATGAPSGWGITETLEGIPVYSVFFRSPKTGWFAAVGIPVEVVNAPILRSYLGFGGSVALAAVLGLVASSLVSRTITRPLHELGASAARMRAGEAPAMPRTGLPAVRSAISALIDAYRERERLLHSEQQARLLEQEARRIAERTNVEKDELLATLGHEFRNPLAAISSAAEVLARGDELPREAAEQAAGIIRRQVKHLAVMTEEVLETSRAMSGKIHIERRPVELSAVLTRALDALRSANRLGEHRLRVRAPAAWVEGDAGRLEQVVTNLLNNALKYTPADGTIEVEVSCRQGEAFVHVRDDGLGIDGDLLPRVFAPFVQGPRTLDRAQGGLGIGLSLVQRLVKLHGGDVQAKSDGPGRGSEFIVRLPALNPSGQTGRPMTPERGRRMASIVVVEDNEDVRTSLRHLLHLAGHRVCDAADGAAGLTTILDVRPDIAIVDIGLPQLDGYAVARAVRDGVGAAVRLIALTGYGTDEDVRRGTSAGFDDYLIKPVDPARLGALIERWLNDLDSPPTTASAPRS